MDPFEKLFVVLKGTLILLFIMAIAIFAAAIYKDVRCYEDSGLPECVQSGRK